jgi:HD-like signal output (HDOD) protein
MLEELTVKNAEKLLAGVVIPPRPEVLGAVLAERNRPEPDLRRINQLVGSDAGLAAALLKTINSPFYGLRRQVSSIEQATSLLGVRNVCTIVTSLSLRRNLPSKGYERFWDSAARQAAILSFLAKTLGCVDRDEAHLYGLFHDCGIPLLMQRFPDYKETLMAANREAGRSFTQVEDERHATNHAVVGALMAGHWGLAAELREATLVHHELDVFQSRHSSVVLNLVALGLLAEHIENGYSRLNAGCEWQKLGEAALAHLMLDDAQFSSLSREATELLDESGL